MKFKPPGIFWRSYVEAYQGLPQHIQGQVRGLLREDSLQKQSGDERALTL